MFCKMLDKKRGMIGQQVNWIYVLIAGSLILIFFTSLVYKQKQAAEQATAEEALRAVEALTMQPPRSSQLTHFSGIDLKVSCASGITTLRIGKASPLRASPPTFAPEQIKSNEIITMTDEWLMPFKAANFVYITANDTRHLIVYDAASDSSEALSREIYSDLPEQSNKELLEKTKKTTDTNTRRTVVVAVATEPAAQGWMRQSKDKSVTAIKISPEPSPDPYKTWETGTVTYYAYNKATNSFTQQSTIRYTERAMMTAAIYSENRKMLECAMEKAYERLHATASVYLIRAKKLQEAVQEEKLPGICADKYSTETIEQIKTTRDAEALYELKQALEQQNRQALLASCPTIY